MAKTRRLRNGKIQITAYIDSDILDIIRPYMKQNEKPGQTISRLIENLVTSSYQQKRQH
ncbi:MAG: hypothetical protein JW840_00555 [Candidatus Thermoplasmatota archaeon]|nr:hypothetical protein [Candidatus Thermoplasmatota archaeon]